RVFQVDIESLVACYIRVLVYEHYETLGSLAGGKTQRADGSDVIPPLTGGNVRGEVVDARSARGIADAVNRNRDCRAGFNDTVVSGAELHRCRGRRRRRSRRCSRRWQWAGANCLPEAAGFGKVATD